MRLLAISLLLLSSLVSAKIVPATYFKTTQNFIDKMVTKHDFNRDELLTIFATVKFKIADKPIKKNKVKRVKKPPMVWDKYRDLFLTEERINNGVKFWKDNLAVITRAEKTYNVPAEIIVAILGIETSYGSKKGTHSTFKVLTTRAFTNYRRRNFYRNELESFLLMSRDNAIAPLSVKGSYAGAMGFPQFIASSYRHYAVDFDHDGVIDLFSSPADAIGSIANYFDQHHWHDFGEIARPIELHGKQLEHAKRANSKPKMNAKFWRNKGFNIDVDINDKTKLAFIRLPQKTIDETWLTFWNFYVLTRYNHDNRYAITAYRLSEKIKQQFNLKY
ncbi:lytic murein transglycosylase B [Bathymodiolus septemdierum thioautotrophic gill symbiont]|uniref:Membrane-bound lytic murein transglycosylase B n=1 Tax=endosymbiont of Bathymodiolus septemdierum str. Myojin knoll TaxID=1303921 RepID=A0A0N7KBB5_9GAMM|nr:lytic murein transglycosylase B [Bathymodiolus septemdierum thioautotrophic gill symbiont]BAS67551.1 membrane-bound lytic murein transglycosylase B [endosymbiont of Bathymodiolus septemdierum str. Myojin knoll]